jgi:hypothetical protein
VPDVRVPLTPQARLTHPVSVDAPRVARFPALLVDPAELDCVLVHDDLDHEQRQERNGVQDDE